MSINKLICGASTTNQMIETVNACVDGSKALDGIKALEAIEGVTLNVTGFYAGSTVGGGQFIYDATRGKADHNGGTVIAPEAIAAWDGTSGDIATLTGWTGTGVGCFVRLGDNLITTPATFGGVADKVIVSKPVEINGAVTIKGANAIRGSYGAGAVATNLAIGDDALSSNTTGSNNNAFGREALLANTTGSNNNAFGREALSSNTTGYSNSAFGREALLANTTGYNNNAFGYRALSSNTTGYSNSAFGREALLANTTGYNNIAVGREALLANTAGAGNIGIGGKTSANVASPVFNVTTENNRIVMGSTSVTNAYIQVAWTVVSDKRDKTNIKDLDLGLDFISQLKPVSYNFRMSRDSDEINGNKRYGFIAQDILAAEGDDPVIIDNEVEEKLKFNDQSLQAVMVKAIQDLNEIVKQQALEIQNLKGGN